MSKVTKLLFKIHRPLGDRLCEKERARRVEIYRRQVDHGGTFEWLPPARGSDIISIEG